MRQNSMEAADFVYCCIKIGRYCETATQPKKIGCIHCSAASTFGIFGLFENGFSHFQFVLCGYCDISISFIQFFFFCEKRRRGAFVPKIDIVLFGADALSI